MSRQLSQVYLGPKDVNTIKASKILDRLNSLNSAGEMASVIAAHTGQRVLSIRLARRILSKRVELGGFQDLRQVAAVTGVGTKILTTIIYALGDHA